jgi:hypothetical protein
MQENLLSLDDVKTHFEHWRTTRTKQHERIPQYLWEEVKTLLDRYLLSEITTALRINTSQIKDNLKINTKINFAVAQIDTLNSPGQSKIFTDKDHTCAIELHRANGMILKISALPIPSLQTLISQFME